MKYLLLVYLSEEAAAQCARDGDYEASLAFVREIKASGEYRSAAPLRPVSTAKTVRVRKGRRTVTDGPFAETHELLGGFYLVDTATMDDALAIAARVPGAIAGGSVEVRPLVELEELSGDYDDR